MMQGSCLCGQITYRVDCEPQPYGHCHCRTCRKAHGAAFSTVMGVPKQAFVWVSGEDQLSSFESSPGKRRYFCSKCGSQLIARRDGAEYTLIRVGSLDTEIATRPQVHFWCSDGANWYDPNEKLPILSKGVPD